MRSRQKLDLSFFFAILNPFSLLVGYVLGVLVFSDVDCQSLWLDDYLFFLAVSGELVIPAFIFCNQTL